MDKKKSGVSLRDLIESSKHTDLAQSSEADSLQIFSNYADFLMIAAPTTLAIATGGPIAAALTFFGLLGVKDKLVGLGKVVRDKISRTSETKHLTTRERLLALENLHGWIVHTAFIVAAFEQLNEYRDFWRHCEAKSNEIAGKSGKPDDKFDRSLRLDVKQVGTPALGGCDLTEGGVIFDLYVEIAQGFTTLLDEYELWTNAQHGKHEEISARIKMLPMAAVRSYVELCLEAGLDIPEFNLWMVLLRTLPRENDGAAELNARLLERIVTSVSNMQGSFESLAQQVAGLSTQQAAHQLDEKERYIHGIWSGLKEQYRHAVDKPILDRGVPDVRVERAGHGVPVFPDIKDCFIPQCCRAIQFEHKLKASEVTFTQAHPDDMLWNTHDDWVGTQDSFLYPYRDQFANAELPFYGLEEKESWENAVSFDDIRQPIQAYLTSTLSTPLLILGNPGSGKSMLTKMLAAELPENRFSVVRIELRFAGVYEDILDQILGEIRATLTKGRRGEVELIDLDADVRGTVPVFIFDGYDELLLTTRKTHLDFFAKVTEFLEDTFRDIPAKAIITSRLNLISMAEETMPEGMLVLRIDPFSSEQIQRWIDIWNSANTKYFEHEGIRPFQPRDDMLHLTDLMQEPVLLLILALFDSDSNALDGITSLQSTVLYDRIFRQYIHREHVTKYSREVIRNKQDSSPGIAYTTLPQRQQQLIVDQEMERLSHVAACMFARGRLYIRDIELAEDLKVFLDDSMLDQDPLKRGESLFDPSLLFGGYLFIHTSRRTVMKEEGGELVEHNDAEVYEFMHATFAEFLVAEGYVRFLRKLGTDNNTIRYHRPSAGALFTQMPMFRRPNMMPFLQDWMHHEWTDFKPRTERSEDDLPMQLLGGWIHNALLGDISQIQPVVEPADTSLPRKPQLSRLATLTLNAVLLQCQYIGEHEFLLESAVEGINPWDQLTHLWRSWFSYAELAMLQGMIKVTRGETIPDPVLISSSATSQLKPQSYDTLFQMHSASTALGDDALAVLTGYFLVNTESDQVENALKWLDANERAGLNLEPELIAQALKLVGTSDKSIKQEDVEALLINLTFESDSHWYALQPSSADQDEALKLFREQGNLSEQYEELLQAVWQRLQQRLFPAPRTMEHALEFFDDPMIQSRLKKSEKWDGLFDGLLERMTQRATTEGGYRNRTLLRLLRIHWTRNSSGAVNQLAAHIKDRIEHGIMPLDQLLQEPGLNQPDLMKMLGLDSFPEA